MREAMSFQERIGGLMDRPYLLALLAEIMAANGQPSEALAQVTEALGVLRKSRSYFYEAELYRLRGTFRSLNCGRSGDRSGLSQTTEIAIRPVRTCDRSESRYPVACDAPVPFCGWKQCSSFGLHQRGSSRLRRLGHLFSLIVTTRHGKRYGKVSDTSNRGR